MRTTTRPEWKQAACFFALCFLLLGLIPLIAKFGGISLDFDAAAARASAETGIEWTSNLLVVFRLSFAAPTLWLLVLGSAIPSLAALVVAASIGRGELRRLKSRFRPYGPGVAWNQTLRVYGLLCIAIPICLLAVFGLRLLLPGPDYAHPADVFGFGLVSALVASAFLDQGGVLEELGWRGFGQMKLQDGLLSPLAAAILVGTIWGLWHVPRDVVSGVIERLGLVHYLLLYLPSFLAGTVTTSIIATYFVNRTGGSVIPAIMVHGLTNDAVGLSGTAAMDMALSPYHQATKALPFLVLAVVIVIGTGKELGVARSVDAQSRH